MADGPAVALQKAVIDALRAAPAIKAAVGPRVVDEPVPSIALPYIRLGNLDLRPFRTDGCAGWTALFSIEVHSRPNSGRIEAARIAGLVIATLDERAAFIAVAGFRLAWLKFVTSTTTRADDGKTYLSIAAFEAVLDA